MSEREKEKQIDLVLGSLTLEQKAGQCFVFGFSGTLVSRDIISCIRDLNCAGLRVSPRIRKFLRYLPEGSPGIPRVSRPVRGDEKDFKREIAAPLYQPQEYAEVLDSLQAVAMERKPAVPLSFSLDYEGDISADFCSGGMVTFPAAMGLAGTKDPEIVYRVARAVARQQRAMGIHWIQGPVLDVNTDTRNPEIGTRSFSSDPGEVSCYGTRTFEGYRDEGIISTGKHFPGRGHSHMDPHYDIPVTELSESEMWDVHLAPYRELIPKGLPVVLPAHCSYPSLDPTGEIATLSKPIITGVLREKLGFQGVIMSDSFTMGGLVRRYEVCEAVVKAIEAGLDLILLKDENQLRKEVHASLIKAVRSGPGSQGWKNLSGGFYQ